MTNRSEWPRSRSSATASTAPGDRGSRDVQHAVDVEENAGHGVVSLFGSRDRSPSRWPRSASASRGRADRVASTRTRGDTRRGEPRPRDDDGADRAAAQPGDRPRRPDRARRRAGRAQPGPEPRAGARAAGREAAGGAPRRTAARADDADHGVAGAAARDEAPPGSRTKRGRRAGGRRRERHSRPTPSSRA